MAVVGAGPAGLAASRALADAGCRHVVLERKRIGWSWRTQRWDSFRLNTPVWMNRVPGEYLAGAPATFATADALLAGLERFADGLPVFEGVEVLRAEPVGPVWRLETSRSTIVAAAVVVASGFQNVPRRPDYAAELPAGVDQLHVADYRRPEDLAGAVLVVGGAQSGLQIAEDLLDGGHRVYLSTSRVGRLPRHYRGRDAFEWMQATGQLDLPSEQAEPAAIAATPPQVSGAAGGRTVSYQHLAKRGVTLLGRTIGWDGTRLELAADLGSNLRFADEVSNAFRGAWDKHAVLESGELVPADDRDPADEPAADLYTARGPASLDLAAEGISTVIWATGFDASTGWLPAGALDERGHPQVRGLHVIGAPWLTHRSSPNLYGMTADAERLAGEFASAGLRAVA
ncbi:MAG TPA: NAD(P)-binding domain-containing protein [Gaiellaceae bacterium]|nr:NAD(P)-binding domain-containing protein [Gaiellaceae bacterium]